MSILNCIGRTPLSASPSTLWVFQRNASGQAQLFEFGPDRKLIRTVSDDVIGHQEKAHGIAIDAEDNL